jgi:hypothetical protein
MRTLSIIAAIALSMPSLGFSQEATPEDPIQAAIRAFNNRSSKKPNEITVVLDPPEPAKPPANDKAKPSDAQPTDKTPVLVTGKPPSDSTLVEPHEGTDKGTDKAEEPAELIPDEPPKRPESGLQVHVENVQSGTGNIDPTKVMLHAPFPAKPLSQAPEGWRIEASDDAPPFSREVELAPGKTITLSIRPHLLLPQADGTDFFAVSEPGFNASLGYQQHATVAAVLSQSIQRLDDDSKQIGSAIDQLQQLLLSLPKPQTSAPTPAPTPAAPTPKKR